MSYFKTKNGVTTMVQKGSAPEKVNRFETRAYRDPYDLLTGTITMANDWSFLESIIREPRKSKAHVTGTCG
jgi:hypothetical protein